MCGTAIRAAGLDESKSMRGNRRRAAGGAIRVPRMNRSIPSITVMRRAFAEKDASFDGLFVVAVRTTGIFCRPTCRARPPRPENVEFFADAAEAAAQGYRACKMCRPTEPPGRAPAVVGRLKEL